MIEPLLEVRNLKKYFDVKGQALHAVDDVSFTINEGETMGLVGESGCGKTTVGNLIVRLLDETSGSILFRGEDITKYSKKKKRELCKDIQIIFQDPYTSLNPKKTVRKILGEAFIVQHALSARKLDARITELCTLTNIPLELLDKYPHELDGGKRQTIGVARAVSLSPKLIVCDEPVSSLDVSIQAQIINMMMDLQKKKKLTYLFISHDLSVVKHISTRIKVMYLGKIVEEAFTDDLFENPQHPYTQALLSAVPSMKAGRDKRRIVLEGDVPSPIDPAPGCRFRQRCWLAKEICSNIEPELSKTSQSEHRVACHFAGMDKTDDQDVAGTESEGVIEG